MYLSVRSGGVIWTLREGGAQPPNHKNKLFSLVKDKRASITDGFADVSNNVSFANLSHMSGKLAMVLMQKLGSCAPVAYNKSKSLSSYLS